MALDAMPLPDAWEPIFPAEQSQWATHRVVGKSASGPSIDQVIERLRGVGGDEQALGEFCRVNRDLLDYRFLYRMTADKLRAENTGQTEACATLQSARVRVVKACQAFDTPLFKEVAAAEGRLGGLLALYMQGRPPAAADVVGAAGDSPSRVSSALAT
mgnify:CR=1 FL=1